MKQILKVFSSFVLCVSCGCTSAAKSHETLSENDPTPVYRGMPSGSNDLIYTLSPVVCYDGYDESLDEILEHTDAVIYGEVTDFVFSEVSVEISTFLTVHVNEVLYGDLFGVSEVRIFKSGGYIPASEYFSIFNLIDGLKDRFGQPISSYTPEELKTKYVGYLPDEYSDPKIGVKGIFFIERFDAFDCYSIADAPFNGEYHDTDSGLYDIRIMADPDEGSFFTYDQVKEKLFNAVHHIE